MAFDLATHKILVTGGDGQLAQSFQDLLKKQGISGIVLSKADCDITNKQQVAQVVQDIGPGILINCAAYNMVDMAESQSALAMQVNSIGVRNLAFACRDKGIFMVHFGTDYVFDGKKGSPYVETDMPGPLSMYGQSKLEGERMLINSGVQHLLFRVSWLYGHGQQNFLYKLRTWLEKGDIIQVSTDEVSVPTYTVDVVAIVIEALQRGLQGTYHLTNSEFCSRFELAQYFFSEMGIERLIVPVEQKSFSLPAKRPLFSAMSNVKLSMDLNKAIPVWQDALKRYCRDLKGGK
jgi:dTDP-4-dehydrorhamnose reductase